MSPCDLLVVSNGHGEDVIGSALVAALQSRVPGLEVKAFPLVGVGTAYEPGAVVGPRRSLPAAGLTLHHPALLLEDLRAGIIALTYRQLAFLRRQRPAAVLVIGDAYAQALAALVRAPRAVLQPLVSVLQDRPLSASRLNRYFMESIRPPERLLLSAARRVYTRDEPTAAALRSRGVTNAVHLGNPIMDGLEAEPLIDPTDKRRGHVIALLPGSRAYACDSVALMVAAIGHLADGVAGGTPVTALVAWTAIDAPTPAPGWTEAGAVHVRPYGAGGPQPPLAGNLTSWRRGSATVRFEREAFAAVLASADVVIGTAGTANEQAAGLGLPVVSFPVPPYYGAAFLENQERLLGGALRVVKSSPHAIARAVSEALIAGPHREAARTSGPLRLGGPGGTAAVADDLAKWLGELR